MKRWASILLGVLISAATLAYALGGQDFSKIGTELRTARYVWVVPTLLLVLIGLGFRGMRWRELLNNRTSFIHSFHIMNVGYFFNAWLPLRLGEVARAFLTTRLQPPLSIFLALSSVVVERLVDLLSVVGLVVVAVLIAPVSPDFQRGAAVTAALAVGGILVLGLFAARRSLAHQILGIILKILPFLERLHLRQVLDHTLDGIAPLSSPRRMGLALFWSALAWASSVVAGFVLLLAFYDDPNWIAALLMIAAASIAVALPAVPGNVGPFEAAVILGLNAGGMINATHTQEKAFAFAVVIHIVNVGSYAFLGWIGLNYEKVTFGEVIRSARMLVARRNQESAPAAETPSERGQAQHD
ncbi:MAG: flippase-like domain-containing protein [Anaerolinea sp.]|nr:flippase-like domain-containing protein [Anaerolinea sp.]MCC6976062.1 flippase-like domain-containing protein [Anaerolineae bacterium]CAG0956285.1 hypothetical protein PLCT2_00486 [Planctomycetaceae bacterium]